MTHQDFVNELKKHFPSIEVKPKFENQAEVRAFSGDILNVLSTIRNLGFEHLCEVTCVDWPEENRIDVIYNLWSYEHHVHVTVKSGLGREKMEIATAINIWRHAQPYEQIAHEMFGVVFLGNPDLSPVILHNWQDIPPLRKDFDTEAYSRKAYE